MASAIILLNKPKNTYGFRDIISKYKNNKNTNFFIVVESEAEALKNENIIRREDYCSDVGFVAETFELGGENLCITNDTFLQAVQGIVQGISRGTNFISSFGCDNLLILNDKLPWLEYLPNGEVKFGVDPEFLKVYKDHVLVLTDNYEGGDLKKYCNLNGFEVIFEDTI